MSDLLSYEICKRIFADIGVVPGDYFGKVGLVDQSLKLAKQMTVRYDDKDRAHDVYSAKLKINESELRAILIDLTVDSPEFIFIFRFDELPIHAMKIVFDMAAPNAYCKVYNAEKQIWYEASIHMKARLLVDFEKIVSWGFLWEDCKDINDLYETASELIV